MSSTFWYYNLIVCVGHHGLRTTQMFNFLDWISQILWRWHGCDCEWTSSDVLFPDLDVEIVLSSDCWCVLDAACGSVVFHHLTFNSSGVFAVN